MGYIYTGHFLDTNRFMLGIPVKNVLKQLTSDMADSVYPAMAAKSDLFSKNYPANFNGFWEGYEPKDEYDDFVEVYRTASSEVEEFIKNHSIIERLENDEYFIPIYSKWAGFCTMFRGQNESTFLNYGFLFMYEKYPILWTDVPIVEVGIENWCSNSNE